MSADIRPVFITGATGSIGSRLALRLAKRGERVRALVRNPERADALRRANIELFPGDLSRPDSLRGGLDGCGRVYHCAAKIAGTDLAAYRAVNVNGTRALLEEAVRAGVERFVQISSIAVYGLSETKNISEDFPWEPSSLPYVITKREADELARSFNGRFPVTTARLGDVMGPGQQAWTIDFIERIDKGLLLPPNERDSGILNPVYIDNLIDALVLLGDAPEAAGEIFNVVDGTPIHASDYIRRLARMAGKHPPAVPGFVLRAGAALLGFSQRMRGQEAMLSAESPSFLLEKRTVSGEKIRRVLGWTPAVGLEEGFERTEAWLRENGYLRNGSSGAGTERRAG